MRVIAFDTETYDPGLLVRGPGGLRREGHLVGVSIYGEGYAEYIPIGHVNGSNVPIGEATRKLRDVFSSPGTTYVGANILYDIEWLHSIGIEVLGRWVDIQSVENLIDDSRTSYSLEALGLSYFNKGKLEGELEQWGLNRGIKNIKSMMHIAPIDLVGKYAVRDAELTRLIYLAQLQKIDCPKAMEVESALLPALWDIRKRGVRVDIGSTEAFYSNCMERHMEAIQSLTRILGRPLDIYSALDVASACKVLGLQIPGYTGKGAPSFSDESIGSSNEPFFKELLAARKYYKTGDGFLKKAILEMVQSDGRIRCSFRSGRHESGGAVTGRLSASKPNLNQVPSRDPEIGPRTRSLFLPEEGHSWASLDVSQEEIRMFINYAIGLNLEGAKEAGEAIKKGIDYHSWCAEMTGLPRKRAKTVTLGSQYGMGVKTLATQNGWEEGEAKKISDIYHAALPFVRTFTTYCSRLLESRARANGGEGYVTTILGRKRRYRLWSPPYSKEVPLPFEDALNKWGNHISLYGAYKAANSVIQGGSADMLKLILIALYREKIQVHFPVHDEVNFSFCREAEVHRAKEIMEGIFAEYFKLPFRVDIGMGLNWGAAK